MSPAQFWHWFGQAQPGIELYGSERDNDLADLIENIFAEFTGGYIDAEELLLGLTTEVEQEFPAARSDRRGVA